MFSVPCSCSGQLLSCSCIWKSYKDFIRAHSKVGYEETQISIELGQPDKGLLIGVLFQSCMFDMSSDLKMGNRGDPCAGPIAKPKRRKCSTFRRRAVQASACEWCF
jgi:hypothetical protein